MYVATYVIDSLSTCMVFTAFLIVELRKLKSSAYTYIAQSLFLVCIFLSIAYFFHEYHFYIWSISALITKTLIVPLLLIRAINKVGATEEEEPLVPSIFSYIIDTLLVGLGFWLCLGLPLPKAASWAKPCLGVSIALLLLGTYGMASRRCALKQTICLCHMENGVHLLLAILAYTSPITVEVGILTDAVIAIALMTYLSILIKRVTGSTDTYRLSSLRW